MISIVQPRLTSHRLARFVTPEAIALLLNIKTEDIYRIDFWRYVIHVVGRGISTFVSYADIPPILETEPPTNLDFIYWHQRWQKNKQPSASNFWVEFYLQKFKNALSPQNLFNWGKLIGIVKSAFSNESLQLLRDCYIQEKVAWNN